jgi:hypothetical protein
MPISLSVLSETFLGGGAGITANRELAAFKTKGLRADVEYTLRVEDRRMTIIRGVP